MTNLSTCLFDLLSQLPGSIGFKNQNFVYEFLNHQGLALFEIHSLPKKDLTDDMLIPSSSFDTIRKQDQDILNNGGVINSIHFYKNKDWLFWSEKKPYIHQGKIEGILTHGTLLNKRFFNALKKLAPMTDRSVMEVFTISEHDFNTPLVNLTAKQQRCVFWYLRGKTSREIGLLVNLSHRTVDDHLEHVKEVYGLMRRRELFDLAQSNGWIHIIPLDLIASFK